MHVVERMYVRRRASVDRRVPYTRTIIVLCFVSLLFLLFENMQLLLYRGSRAVEPVSVSAVVLRTTSTCMNESSIISTVQQLYTFLSRLFLYCLGDHDELDYAAMNQSINHHIYTSINYSSLFENQK